MGLRVTFLSFLTDAECRAELCRLEAICGHQSEPHAAATVSGLCTGGTMAECNLRHEEAPIRSEAAFSLLPLQSCYWHHSGSLTHAVHCPSSEAPVSTSGEVGSMPKFVHNVHVLCVCGGGGVIIQLNAYSSWFQATFHLFMSLHKELERKKKGDISFKKQCSIRMYILTIDIPNMEAFCGSTHAHTRLHARM